jgi:hypothetical protein
LKEYKLKSKFMSIKNILSYEYDSDRFCVYLIKVQVQNAHGVKYMKVFNLVSEKMNYTRV